MNICDPRSPEELAAAAEIRQRHGVAAIGQRESEDDR